MNFCPICSRSMLRHYSQRRLYYFCAKCRQEMPCSLSQKTSQLKTASNLSDSFPVLSVKKNSLMISH